MAENSLSGRRQHRPKIKEYDTAGLIRLFLSLERYYQVREVAEDKRKTLEAAEERAKGLQTGSVVVIVIGFVALLLTGVICIFSQSWRFAAFGGALGVAFFVWSGILSKRSRTVQVEVAYAQRDCDESADALACLKDEGQRLQSLLPDGYDDSFAVNSMLKALLRGRAKTFAEAKKYHDVCVRRAEDELHEYELMTQFKGQADNAQIGLLLEGAQFVGLLHASHKVDD